MVLAIVTYVKVVIRTLEQWIASTFISRHRLSLTHPASWETGQCYSKCHPILSLLLCWAESWRGERYQQEAGERDAKRRGHLQIHRGCKVVPWLSSEWVLVVLVDSESNRPLKSHSVFGKGRSKPQDDNGFIPTVLAIIENTENSKWWQGCGEPRLFLCCWWKARWYNHVENTVAGSSSRSYQIESPSNPATPWHPGAPTSKTWLLIDICAPMFIAVSFPWPKGHSQKCQSTLTNKWKNKMYYVICSRMLLSL